MSRSADWNLSKGSKVLSNFAIASVVAFFVPLHFSPASETLALVGEERLFLYSLGFGISFLAFGEMVGLSERRLNRFSLRHLILFGLTAFLASLALLLGVWIVEFSFVGRFAILKIASFTGIGCFLFLSIFNRLARQSRSRIFLLTSDETSRKIKGSLSDQAGIFEWLKADDPAPEGNFLEFCKDHEVDLVVMDESPEAAKVEIVPLLEAGTRVMGEVDFWEHYLNKIPPSAVDQSWLAKLDLRLRDPFSHKLKRLMDLIFGVLGLLLSLPILLPTLCLIAIDSGFPLFFTQRRTGFMGRSYTLYKLRTMKKDAEKTGAEWAREKDQRVTRCGKYLRKWRIDEIPQFWNVIKGEMSIVGPRPERPEFQDELIDKVPHWNCRHLVKPGLTGWAQIRFRYASDVDASEEKLAFDLYYIKNASIMMDLQIILSTLRFIARGSR
jgi:exopolysaccharide biosynthesis polyprenyl glycosylphosphotransferase